MIFRNDGVDIPLYCQIVSDIGLLIVGQALNDRWQPLLSWLAAKYESHVCYVSHRTKRKQLSFSCSINRLLRNKHESNFTLNSTFLKAIQFLVKKLN